jgi:hypothetical protein
MKDSKKTIIAVGLLVLVCIIIYLVLFWHKSKPSQLPATIVMYSSFGPTNSFDPNCWSAGANAHADWFVPSVSGTLSVIEIAVEPSYVRKGMEKTAGDLDLFLAQDESGFPGAVLERFSLAAGAPNSPPPSLPLVFKSVAQPKLQAGVKYWLGAKSSGPGEWTWHFGDRKLVQKAAREKEQGKWGSAGDYCYVGAFSVIVTTNHELLTH